VFLCVGAAAGNTVAAKNEQRKDVCEMNNNKGEKKIKITKPVYYALLVCVPLGLALITHLIMLVVCLIADVDLGSSILIIDLFSFMIGVLFAPALPSLLSEFKKFEVPAEVEETGEKIGKIFKIAGIVLAVLCVIFYIAVTSCNEMTDYYIDYNDNGKMDSGEYVYSEDSYGKEYWDFDGDGLWDN